MADSPIDMDDDDQTPMASANPNTTALDLSRGLFAQYKGKSFEIYSQLQILVLAGTRLVTEDLNTITSCTELEKLDISHCGLTSMPEPSLWSCFSKLTIMFTHRNNLGRWEDVESVTEIPTLAWLTFFENPIASQPEYREYVIERAPQLMALDPYVITDDERLMASGEYEPPTTESGRSLAPVPSTRFTTRCKATEIAMDSHPPVEPLGSRQLQREMLVQQYNLRHQSNKCSAACCIQTCFKGFNARRNLQIEKVRWTRAITTIQRHTRTFLWRRSVFRYLKDYLAEIDELDLLLSATEMQQLKAAKVIQLHVRRWLSRRKDRRKVREAIELVRRNFQGFWVRTTLIRQYLELRTYRRVYFPEHYAWEFLTILNIIRKGHKAPPLEMSHKFDPADMYGIRFPEPDEMPERNAAITTLMCFSGRCLVRPKYSKRYPNHLWDGPFHRLVDKTAPAHIQKAYSKVRRRGANVNNRCRKAFLLSCAPGPHPIDVKKQNQSTGSKANPVCLALKGLLEGPESMWPAAAQDPASPLHMFLQAARQIGGKPLEYQQRGMVWHHGPTKDPETALRVYRTTSWLGQRLMYYECPTPRFASDLIFMLINFNKSADGVPLVNPVPFLMEKTIRDVTAATVIQAAWRGHRTRCSLSCGLLVAVVLRRAAVCIQRFFRWGLLKRRFELLLGACRYIKEINTPHLFIEERLFTALNLINSIDRFAPMLQERALGFGFSTDVEKIVLIRNDLRDGPGFRAKGATAKEAAKARAMQRSGGLPQWFMNLAGDLPATGPDDPSLKLVDGLQGVIIEGLSERTEDHVQTVSMPSIEYAAQGIEASKNELPAGSPALAASSGSFRFIALNYPTLASARLRALLLYMCTFDAHHHVAVPLLSKPMLRESSICWNILRLWDLYGLTWPSGDRAAVFQLKQRYGHLSMGVVPFCGPKKLRSVIGQQEWQHADGQRVAKSEERKAEIEKAVQNRYSGLSKQFENRKKKAVRDLEDGVAEVSPHRFTEAEERQNPSDVVISGAMPPTTTIRCEDISVVSAMVRGEKAAAKKKTEERFAKEREEKQKIHDDVRTRELALPTEDKEAQPRQLLEAGDGGSRPMTMEPALSPRGMDDAFFAADFNSTAYSDDLADRSAEFSVQQVNYDDDRQGGKNYERRGGSVGPSGAQNFWETRIADFHSWQDQKHRLEYETTKQNEAIEEDRAKKERVKRYHFELTHKKAEREMEKAYERVEKIEKKLKSRSETDQKLAEQELLREQELNDKRAEIEARKDARKKKKETKATLERFLVKQNVVEKTCRMVDTQKVRDYEAEKAANKLANKKSKWERKTAIMTEKKELCVQQKYKQLKDMQKQFDHVLKMQRQSEQLQLEEKRRLINAEKEFDRLVRIAREELVQHERGVVSAEDVRVYERTLQAFRDLAENVKGHALVLQESLKPRKQEEEGAEDEEAVEALPNLAGVDLAQQEMEQTAAEDQAKLETLFAKDNLLDLQTPAIVPAQMRRPAPRPPPALPPAAPPRPSPHVGMSPRTRDLKTAGFPLAPAHGEHGGSTLTAGIFGSPASAWASTGSLSALRRIRRTGPLSAR